MFHLLNQDSLLKALILLIIVSFLSAPLTYATPAPSSAKVPVEKTGAEPSVNKGQQKDVKAKKKTKVTTQKYKVRSGDSLYTIARRHGMRLADLQRMNCLKSSKLKIGQVLTLSGQGKKSGKSQGSDEMRGGAGESLAQIAIPNEDGLYVDSLADAGVEPIARTYLSIPYRYGAQSRKSTDCSGFVQQVFREFDINLPRTAREQYKVGKKIDSSSLSSGDLVFFRTRARKKYPTHVGIYLGNGKMIHASSRQRKVVISDLNHPYYVKRYIGAKRTATFLPGEIDLEMLARQVTGTDVDAPLADAIVAEVHAGEVIDTLEILTVEATPSVIMEAGYDDRGEDPDDAVDDIDNDVEPEAEELFPAPPQLGILPDEAEGEGAGEVFEVAAIASGPETVALPRNVEGEQ